MFDCMEPLGMGPRQLYDVTNRGACMLRKASPFFTGLDHFAWTGTTAVQYTNVSVAVSHTGPPFNEDRCPVRGLAEASRSTPPPQIRA
ncbi:retinoic acid receptor gamma-A isoform X2 [Tachysurus ichikawai]